MQGYSPLERLLQLHQVGEADPFDAGTPVHPSNALLVPVQAEFVFAGRLRGRRHAVLPPEEEKAILGARDCILRGGDHPSPGVLTLQKDHLPRSQAREHTP